MPRPYDYFIDTLKSPSKRMGIFSVGDLRFFRGLKKCPPDSLPPPTRRAPGHLPHLAVAKQGRLGGFLRKRKSPTFRSGLVDDIGLEPVA